MNHQQLSLSLLALSILLSTGKNILSPLGQWHHCIGTFLSPENYIQLGQNRCPVKFPKNSERILPHCVFRSIFYACVVKGDFFSTSIPCASLVGTQWIFICFFALNFSYFFPEIGRHLFLLFYCYVTSAQRFILQRSRTRLVKIW